MIIYQRYSGICVSIIIFHTYIISYLVYVVKCFIHLLKIFYVSSAIHPTPKGVGFSHYSVNFSTIQESNLFFGLKRSKKFNVVNLLYNNSNRHKSLYSQRLNLTRLKSRGSYLYKLLLYSHLPM